MNLHLPKGDDAATFIWCHKKDEGLEKSSKNGAGEMKVITSTVNAQVQTALRFSYCTEGVVLVMIRISFQHHDDVDASCHRRKEMQTDSLTRSAHSPDLYPNTKFTMSGKNVPLHKII